MPSLPQQEGLIRYVKFFEALTPASLKDIDAYYAPDARFKDPFNNVRGTEKIAAVFDDMFKMVGQPESKVTDTAWSAASPDTAYIRWTFDYKVRGKGAPMSVDGMTRVVFAPDGRVAEHIDYWDAAQGMYEHLPLIGGVLRWIRGRIQIH